MFGFVLGGGWPTIPSEIAAMAGKKKLDIAPISACAVTTGQNDG
jgi:hypothetical protein